MKKKIVAQKRDPYLLALAKREAPRATHYAKPKYKRKIKHKGRKDG